MFLHMPGLQRMKLKRLLTFHQMSISTRWTQLRYKEAHQKKKKLRVPR